MTAEEPRRRRGIYEIGDAELARLLRLPAGQHVVSVSADWARLSLLVMVEGAGLPEVATGHHAPTLRQFRPLTPLGVAKLSPGAAHAAVLAELGAARFEDPDALDGRARILARHAPHKQIAPRLYWCAYCVNDDQTGQPWPCPDYLDAAAGLVTGLPGQAEHAAATAAAGVLEDPGPPTVADLAMLADPATGTAIDAMVLGNYGPGQPRPRTADAVVLATGAALDAATAGRDATLRDRLEQPRRPLGGRPEETDPTPQEG